MERTDFETLRRRLIAGIKADLAREAQQADALRASVIPVVADSVEGARRGGRCGKVWLFGSFAWGEPTDRSDVDLMVADCANPDAFAAERQRGASTGGGSRYGAVRLGAATGVLG